MSHLIISVIGGIVLMCAECYIFGALLNWYHRCPSVTGKFSKEK